MTKQKVKDWKELIRDMQKVDAMRCKPDFTRLSNNFITDEDKSVKWNREQVEENHKQYDDAVKELNTKKNKCCNEAEENIYKVIQDTVGHHISKEAAKSVWYEADHDMGRLQNLCDFLYDFLEEIK